LGCGAGRAAARHSPAEARFGGGGVGSLLMGRSTDVGNALHAVANLSCIDCRACRVPNRMCRPHSTNCAAPPRRLRRREPPASMAPTMGSCSLPAVCPLPMAPANVFALVVQGHAFHRSRGSRSAYLPPRFHPMARSAPERAPPTSVERSARDTCKDRSLATPVSSSLRLTRWEPSERHGSLIAEHAE
jgi:hypothetical protein